MGDDDVEKELAEAFREQREATERGFIRLEGLLEAVRRDAQSHYLDDAARFAKVDASVSTAHKRLDEHLGDHKEERSGRFQLWIGVVLSFVSAILAAIFAAFGGKKP